MAKCLLEAKERAEANAHENGLCARRVNGLHSVKRRDNAPGTLHHCIVVRVDLCPLWRVSERFVVDLGKRSLWAQQAGRVLDVRCITL